MTRLAVSMPGACASCYTQELGARYVDFEAAYDGPVLNDQEPRMQIDDLIVCERCLSEACRLLGWKTDEVVHDLERAGTEIGRLEAELERVTEYAGKLEQVLAKGREAGRLPSSKGRPIKRPEVLHAA